ncbi:MAG: hypothetical protein RLZZ35_732 [Actinomycetota bacterium]
MTTKKSSKSDNAKSEVRISVSDQAREITIEVALDREEVLALVKKALSSNEPLVPIRCAWPKLLDSLSKNQFSRSRR